MGLKPGNSYIFDTTFFIDALRKNPNVKMVYHEARFLPVSVGYSIITEAELWYGINQHKFRTVQQHINLLKPFKRYFINTTIARRGGELRRLLVQSGIDPKSNACPALEDCLIAATADYYNMAVCTNNLKHFNLFTRFSISIEHY